MAALVAVGVAASGERRVLGLELAAGNDEGSAWAAVIRRLVKRGLAGVRWSSATTTAVRSRPSESSSGGSVRSPPGRTIPANSQEHHRPHPVRAPQFGDRPEVGVRHDRAFVERCRGAQRHVIVLRKLVRDPAATQQSGLGRPRPSSGDRSQVRQRFRILHAPGERRCPGGRREQPERVRVATTACVPQHREETRDRAPVPAAETPGKRRRRRWGGPRAGRAAPA